VFLDILLLYFLRFYFAKPLKVFGMVALLLIAGGVLIAGTLLIYSWLTGVSMVRAHGGWFLLSAVAVLIGIQTLLTGVLAEILIRVYYSATGSAGFVVRRELSAGAAPAIVDRSMSTGHPTS